MDESEVVGKPRKKYKTKMKAIEGEVVGRPSSYKPEYCAELIEHMKSGFTYESFAGRVGVDRSTIYEWESHKDFSDAKKKGKEFLTLRNEMLYQQALTGANTRINPTLLIFLMKNCNGWRDKVEVEDVTRLSIDELKAEAKRLLGMDE